MALGLQILAVFVGAFHAVASFFYFSRGRWSAVWAALWTALTVAAVLDERVMPWLWAAVFGWQVWWMTLRPRLDRDWAPDVARQTTAQIADGRLTVRDVRDFRWRSDDDYDVRWETRSYEIEKLESIDLFTSYWSSPAIAHVIVSFGFGAQGRLAFSIEIRRRRGEPWSGFGGFFKVFELVTIAADERDVVAVRTNVRGEDVRLYRMRSTPAFRRRLLAAYVDDCNRLAREPRFFHTILTNCTTQVIRMARAAGEALPFDWRMIVSGYIPDYLHRVGLLDPRPFTLLRTLAAISGQARAYGDGPGFSAVIREGVPAPDA